MATYTSHTARMIAMHAIMMAMARIQAEDMGEVDQIEIPEDKLPEAIGFTIVDTLETMARTMPETISKALVSYVKKPDHITSLLFAMTGASRLYCHNPQNFEDLNKKMRGHVQLFLQDISGKGEE